VANPQILVDADACPVKDEVLRVAGRRGLTVTFVANSGLRPSRDPMVRTVIVPQGPDIADDWIVEHAALGDIVITADVPLASRCVAIGATVLGPTGRAFTPDSVGMALAVRNLNQQLRESGESKGYNKEFRAKDRAACVSALAQAIDRGLRRST
jgi:uncharacterized protein YaiI (UPF0178 family)